MSTDENKALGRRMIDAWNQGDLDALDDVVAPDYIFHDPADPRMATSRKRCARSSSASCRWSGSEPGSRQTHPRY